MALKEILRTFKSALWLSWEVETNWTSPFLYFLYSVIRPLFSMLIVIFIYKVLAYRNPNEDLFQFLYVGSALGLFMLGGLGGLSTILQDDREHYATLKYVYMAPMPFFVYLAGRSGTKVITSAFYMAVALIAGRLFLNIPILQGGKGICLFLLVFVLGLCIIYAAGFLLVGISMLTALHHSFFMSEAVNSILYLLCGVIFPLSMLPGVLKKFAQILPFTHWLELARRALLPPLSLDNGFTGISTPLLLLIFMTGLAVLSLTAWGTFHYIEGRARRKGLLDITTAH
ncbi:MAG: ABC transporter permease [Chloroflexi bacterium]|nr:ABC transporter permease [Chloroflexota bacterium]